MSDSQNIAYTVKVISTNFIEAMTKMELRWIEREEKERERKQKNIDEILHLVKDVISVLPSVASLLHASHQPINLSDIMKKVNGLTPDEVLNANKGGSQDVE